MLFSLLLIVLAVAPGLAIVLYIYLKDRYDPEPKKFLVVSFLLGMVATLPAILVQLSARLLWGETGSQSVVFYIFYAFIVVGCSEEISKFLVVRIYAYPKKAFDEPFDGIVYSIMVAMGFATLENILYVRDLGLETAIVRMFVSVPAHASFGVLMGYYMGLSKFNKERKAFYLVKGLVLAIGFHGAFDFFLFLKNNLLVTQYVSGGLLLMAAMLSFYIALQLSMRSIRLHQELSRLDFEKRNNPL